MATIRVTVTFDAAVSQEVQSARLTRLTADLRATLTGSQRLSRLAGLSLPGAPAGPTHPLLPAPDPLLPSPDALTSSSDALTPAPHAPSPPDRIFKLDVTDGDDARDFLRALGGWCMANPAATIAVKADGPSGGVSLRMDQWSAVGFAGAVARVLEVLTAAP